MSGSPGYETYDAGIPTAVGDLLNQNFAIAKWLDERLHDIEEALVESKQLPAYLGTGTADWLKD